MDKKKIEAFIESYKQKDKLKFIFDSNIYDEIVAGNLKIDDLAMFKNKENAEFYVTHIQVDEISKCSDTEKRAKLFLFMTKISPIIVPTESAVYGISRFGKAKFSNGDLLEKLREGNIKHTKDALIGETAIKEKLILITNDNTLRRRVNLNGGKAFNLEEFKIMMSDNGMVA